jgi:lysophospholipase L1-like esterase
MYQRYVALGDSSTEGLDDPDGQGGYRGWANRLAERIAATQGSLRYANLAVRGRSTREIRDEQLQPALALRPDLVTLFSGTNDVIRRQFDADAVAADILAMHRALIGQGATLLTFTLPDLSPVMPVARWLTPRVTALNAALRQICDATGGRLVDLARYAVAADSRFWSDDRLHANAEGHARIAAALAEALGIPAADAMWAEPLPELPQPGLAERLSGELAWWRVYLLPWLWGRLRGRASGAGLAAKRPQLLEVSL